MFNENDIFNLLGDRSYVPMNAQEIAKSLGSGKNQFHTLQRRLNRLVTSGQIARIGERRYCLPRDANLISGIIKFRQNGSATIIPDSESGNSKTTVFSVRARDTGVAMHKDRVFAQIDSRKKRTSSYQAGRKGKAVTVPEPDQAKVVRIIERGRKTVSGTLKRSHHYFYVIPDDPRLNFDLLVPNPQESTLSPHPKVNHKVIVELKDWKDRHLAPEGEIVRVLGKTHTPSAEFEALLNNYHLTPHFPDPVISESEKIPSVIRKRDLKNRLDLRELYTFTVDPEDAKDFDDAISIETLGSGDMKVGVHIADVSAYVRPGSALDREAQKRGNSTYLVGSVIPMLPQSLSNGICSLIEGEDRLTKTVFLTFSSSGQFKASSFANTVIRSRKRLTYKQTLALLKKADHDQLMRIPTPPAHQTGSLGRPLSVLTKCEINHLQSSLQSLWAIAGYLRRQRTIKGSLELDSSEVKLIVDKKGFTERIEKIQNDESHQLIEEFMVAANESIAKQIGVSKIPLIYRVHDQPGMDRLAELREYLLDFEIRIGDLTHRKEMVKLLRLIKAHPLNSLLRIEVLRSMKPASYRNRRDDGHYGLDKTYYTHFTSPIRRYSDLIMHRVLDRYLYSKNADTAANRKVTHYETSVLSSISSHLTSTEQNSKEAERESVKVKLLEYFERRMKNHGDKSYEALITDVRSHGFFVELKDSMAYGFVQASDLPQDFYFLSEKGSALVGRKSGKSYRIGHSINLYVKKVDRFKRQIDFTV